jgi:hypothetical protein
MKKLFGVISLVLSLLIYVVVHETGHLIFCILFGAKIQGIGFSQNLEGVFIIWERTSTVLYNDLISIGGLLFGFIFYLFASIGFLQKRGMLIFKSYRVIYLLWIYIALLNGRNYELNLLENYSFLFIFILVYISLDMFILFSKYIKRKKHKKSKKI